MVAVTMISAGVASAQTSTTTSSTSGGAHLGVTLTPTARLSPGTPDGLLALIIMHTATSSSGVQTSSLPLTVTYGNGLEASDLSDCRVRNVLDLDSPISAATSLSSGANTLSFSQVTVNQDSTVTLAVTCDIAADAPIGGTALLSITPSTIPATVAGSSTAVTPVVGQHPSGGTGTTSGTVTIASTPSTPPMIPGVPNTGNGMMNLLLLAISGTVIAAGAALLMRRSA